MNQESVSKTRHLDAERLQAVESGLWQGVSRALGNGIDISPVFPKEASFSKSELGRHLDTLTRVMETTCRYEKETAQGAKEAVFWNRRALQHAAESLTIFFLARRHYHPDDPKEHLTEEQMVDFLKRYGGGNPGGWANSWAHDY